MEWARRWVRLWMESDSETWLVDTKFYVPSNRPSIAPLIQEVTFTDLKTGKTTLSTKVNYNHATVAELWVELYNEDPPETESFKLFAEQFRTHHDNERMTGMRPSEIEGAIRRAGFSLHTHRLLSYRSRFDMTAAIKILERDDLIVSPRFELADLSSENFKLGSVHCLL
ncbi:hypothetical protein BKA80DRAFT_308420 [Phyllosticta citrichinensis]